MRILLLVFNRLGLRHGQFSYLIEVRPSHNGVDDLILLTLQRLEPPRLLGPLLLLGRSLQLVAEAVLDVKVLFMEICLRIQSIEVLQQRKLVLLLALEFLNEVWHDFLYSFGGGLRLAKSVQQRSVKYVQLLRLLVHV